MQTNLASEMHDVCKEFSETFWDEDISTAKALAFILGCRGVADPIFLEMLAILSQRFVRLGDLITKSNSIPPELRKTSLDSVNALALFLDPNFFGSPWPDRIREVFVPNRLTTLQFVGGIFQHEFPMEVLSYPEREKLIEKLEERIKELEAIKTRSIAIDATINTLKSIQLILQRFKYFGMEALFDKMLWAHSNLRAAQSYATDENERNLITKALAILGILSLSIQVASDRLDASKNLYNHGAKAIEYLSGELPKEVPLLTHEPGSTDIDLTTPQLLPGRPIGEADEKMDGQE